MSSLLERIAAKKALASAVNLHTPPVEVDILGNAVAPTVAESPATAVASVPEGKPLSFQEKMALKKAQATEQNITAAIASHSATIVETTLAPQVTTPTADVSPVSNSGIKSVQATVEVVEIEEATTEVDLSGVSMEDQQAYVDIKAKINMLSSMSEDGLKDAMSDLKKALLKNPQACYLILPHDIGEMVIALRLMKNEAIVEAESTAKTKGAKKTKATKSLTADEISQAFDEM